MIKILHKIIITGTGRSLTTFLMAILTLLGFDTGYKPEDIYNDYHYNPTCNAGLEKSPSTSGYIHKHPFLDWSFYDNYIIDHVIIPIRNLEISAKSRERIYKMGFKGGSFVCCDTYEKQLQINMEYLSKLFLFLTDRNIPFTTLSFEIMKDKNNWEYLYDKLASIIEFRNKLGTKDNFKSIYQKLFKPELIHF